MDIARDVLNDRIEEIQSYLDFIDKLDKANKQGRSITKPDQYHMVIANTFIMMYNMVEATLTQSIICIEQRISKDNDCPQKLSDEILSEWVTVSLGTKEQLSHEKRLQRGKLFYKHVISNSPITSLFNKGGGNWDDQKISRFFKRFGINHDFIPKQVIQQIKQKKENDVGCMQFITQSRNKLAHGEISFSDYGRDQDIGRIKEIFCDTSKYLIAVVDSLDEFITQRHFIASSENTQHASESTRQ